MKDEAGGFPIRRLLAVCEAIGSGDGKYFPGWKCAAGCAAGPAGARRAAAAVLRWPRLPRSDSRCGGGAKSRPSMPGPGPGPPPPPASSAAGAWGWLGVQAARGWRAGGSVWGHRRHRQPSRSAHRRTGLLGGRPRSKPAAAVQVHGLGRYAAVPGLLSPSPEVPGEAGTITPPPNQIRPGSSSADWGLWGGGGSESQKLFSLGLPNRPRRFSIQRPPWIT